jgi:hypothetical protein
LITLLLVLFAVIAMGTLFTFVRGAVPQSESITNLESLLHPVDLSAFLNLTNLQETEFLHSTLAPASFRRLHRHRTLVALKYLKSLSWNAAVLLRCGELARRSSDQQVAEAGRELADTALRTRILVLRAYLKLAPQVLIPSHYGASYPELISDYAELKQRFGLLASREPLTERRYLSQT